ncbi:MAG TPA: hypothetical protein VGH53_28315, partial [Streptosporangiaceae bacterium]
MLTRAELFVLEPPLTPVPVVAPAGTRFPLVGPTPGTAPESALDGVLLVLGVGVVLSVGDGEVEVAVG